MTVIKDFVLKRPLFCSCAFSAVAAVVCAFIGCKGILVLISALAFLLLLVLPLKSKFRTPALTALIMSLLIAVASFLYQYFLYEPIFDYNGKTVSVNATVLKNDGNNAVLFCNNDETGRNMGFKVKINSEDTKLVPSSKVKLTLTFYSAENNNLFANNGVHITAKAKDIQLISPENTSSPIYIYHRLYQRISELFTMPDAQTTAFVKGMVLGDKTDISKNFLNMFSEIGMSHVMSVSGMHLMFAVIFLDFILAFLGIHYKPRSVIAIISAFVFTFFSGFSVSCVRAFIMLTIYYIGRVTDKISDSLTSLAFSAYVILLISPYNVCNLSFMLSVLATFGMIVITPMLNAAFSVNVKNRGLSVILYSLKSAVTISLGANIACLPVMIIVFKKVSLVSPLSNIVLTAFVQAAFYLSFLFLIVQPFPAIADAVSHVIDLIYSLINDIVEYIYNLKYVTVNDGNIFFYFAFALLAVLLLGIFLYQRRNEIEKIYPYTAAYFAVCIVMFTVTFAMSCGKVKISFVDVGQGSASVIAKDEKAVIIDCGGESRDELLTALRHSSVKHIELIALTHLDNDHVNYISYLINYYKVDKIVYPEFCNTEKFSDVLLLADQLGIQVFALENDTEFEVLNGAKVQAFVEKAYKSKITSNTSGLYKFEYGQTSVCYTGDMSISQEYVYTKYGQQLDCDILVVPHHGSANSSLKSLLEIYSPDYSVISVSADNKYGLPDKRIVSRLEEASKVLLTSEMSTIEFVLDEKGYRLLNK